MIKRNGKNYWVVLTLILLGCNQYEIINLTEKVGLNESADPFSLFDIAVNEIWIYEANKDRHPDTELMPDLINIELHLMISNQTDSTFLLRLKDDENGFKGFIDWEGERDTLSLLNSWAPDKISIKSGESIPLKLGNELYDFERLFSTKKNYTEDMVQLLRTFKFIYMGDQASIPIRYDNGVKVFGKSTKW